jgi:hypothetical protein
LQDTTALWAKTPSFLAALTSPAGDQDFQVIVRGVL